MIGVPDEKWGEAVKAVVVLRDGWRAGDQPGDRARDRAGEAVTVGQLQDLVRERKGAVYTPKTVDFVDSIPVSPLGKPDKKALRARYAQSS